MPKEKRIYEIVIGDCGSIMGMRKKVVAKTFDEACEAAREMLSEKKPSFPIPDKNEIVLIKYSGVVYE